MTRITGNLPLPEGTRLTEAELRKLVEGKPFTTGDTPPPVPTVGPNHKVDIPEAIPIEKLPADKQTKIAADLKEASEFMKQVNVPVVEAPKTEQPKEVVNTPAVADSEQTEANKGPSYCPRCGLDPKQTDLESISQEDRKEWLRSVMSDKSFYKDFPVMGGSMVVRFKTRTIEEADSIQEEMSKIMAQDVSIGLSSMQNIASKQSRLQLSTSLVFISVNNQVTNYSELKGDAKFAGWSEQKLTLIMSVFCKFERIVQTLINHALDDSFWKTGDGKGSSR